MKYLLEDDYEYDFNLLGICCHEKDYRLCWAINNTLGLSLTKSKDNLELIFPKASKGPAYFSVFKHSMENKEITYYLIGNKFENQWLIPEKQHVDYFLMIKSNEKNNPSPLLNKLRSIPFILTAHTVIVDQLRSKENLIF